MSQSTLGEVLRVIHRIYAVQGTRDLTDRELVERYSANRDEAAFAALVKRHGPMVFGVARRLLGDSHEVEDVFQATFLVLVRQIGSIKRKQSVGSWLYGVVRRIALRARTQAHLRRHKERGAGSMRPRPRDELSLQELRTVLDEELGLLPEKYRAPLVLCYLQSHSHEEAARELGCPKITVTKRVSSARELLRRRLERRGITLTTAAMATALTEIASAAPLPAMLTIKTIKAAVLIAAGKSAAGCLSVGGVALADEVVTGMLGLKGKLLLMVLALALAVGSAGWAGSGLGQKAEQAAPTQAPVAKEPAGSPTKNELAVATDLYGDPLPREAMARLGTVRFRHGAMVMKVGFALDGKMVASGGGNILGWDIRLWQTTTGKLLHRLPSTANQFVMSPDGRLLLTADRQLFDAATGKELRRFIGTGGSSNCVAFSPDGRSVAGGEFDRGRVVIWDADTGKELRRLEGPGGLVSSVAFSPDAKLVAAASPESWVQLWEVEAGKKLVRLGIDKAAARAYQNYPVLAFSPTGKVLASAKHNGRVVCLWEPKTGKLLHQLDADGDIAFSADGKLLASGGADGVIRLWDPATGQELRHWQACERNLTSIAFAPDGQVLVSAGMQDHDIRLWDVATGKEVRPFAGHTGVVASMRFAADGKQLTSSAQDNTVLEWDLGSARATGRLVGGAHELVQTWHAHDLAASGKIVAVAGATRGTKESKEEVVVRVWDMAANKELCVLKNMEMVRSVRLSPNAKLIAADNKDGLLVCDAVTGKQLIRIPGERPHGGTLIFSPDGRTLAWPGDRDGTIHLWDTVTGKEIRHWPTGQRKTHTVVFSPDGRLIAGAEREGLRIWNVATGKEVMNARGQSWLSSLAFSASGRILAAGEEQAGQIHLWEVLTGQEIRRITGPQGAVSCLAFAPGGRTLASGGADTTILLWNVATAKAPEPSASTALSGIWSDLAGDAAKAYAAIWTMTRAPAESVSLLKDKLQPVPPANAKLVASLLDDLDSQQFAARQKAAKALDELGEAAESAVRKALSGNLSLELRQRLEKYLEKRELDVMRKLRAIESLEYIGTPEALGLLQKFARETANPRLSEAAKEASARLRTR
jgi:RNA polymerase sigma factor (sigma-70 family)